MPFKDFIKFMIAYDAFNIISLCIAMKTILRFDFSDDTIPLE